MKKTVSLMLALVMLMSMSAVAFADETGVGTGSYSVDVTGTYVAGTTGGTDYSVDIAWSAMSFTYNGEKTPVWDPETHTYSSPEDADAHWDNNTGTITVTNHSNAVISAVPKYTKAAGFEDAEMNFDTNRMYLDTAENGNEAKVGTITVTPSGSLPDTTGEDAVIGTITVTIAGGGLPVIDSIDNYLATCDAHRMSYSDQGLDTSALTSAMSEVSSAYNSGTDMEKTAAVIAVENELSKLAAQAQAAS